MSIEEIRERVSRSRSTTLVARAFRMALGLPLTPVPESRIIHQETFGGLDECFRNHGSPMDGRRYG